MLTVLTCTIFQIFGTRFRNMYHKTPYCYHIISYHIVSFYKFRQYVDGIYMNCVSVVTELICPIFPVFGTGSRYMYHETPYFIVSYRIILIKIMCFSCFYLCVVSYHIVYYRIIITQGSEFYGQYALYIYS